jgi:transposase
MSLQPQAIPPIPGLTAKVARCAFRKGNVYMQMRDVLGTFFTDDQFTDLYPADGQPAYAPWRLALVRCDVRHTNSGIISLMGFLLG